MQIMPLIVMGFVLVALALRRARSQPLRGWQKVLGVIAFVFAVVMLLQPEFLALGLFGDTAFLDLLVLAMSLQMHMFVSRTLRWCIRIFGGCVPRVWTPSPGLSYLLAVSTLVTAGGVSALQKMAHRFLS
ncbi:MAG TPA: hypothetical protein VHI52_13540 [Verrucomicrobiae bacterium]|nr:hypothetical protein [Verrucomicrobiae bacterium]